MSRSACVACVLLVLCVSVASRSHAQGFDSINALTWDSFGDQLVIVHGKSSLAGCRPDIVSPQWIELRDIDDSSSITADLRGVTCGVSAVDFTNDNAYILVRSEAGRVHILASSDLSYISVIETTSAGIQLVTSPSDATTYLFPLSVNSVAVYEFETAPFVDELIGAVTISQGDHTDRINAADWDPTGTRIVTVSDDRTVAIWDAETFGLVERITDPDNLGVSHVAWSPVGGLIAFANHNNVMTVWDVNAQDTEARVLLGSTMLNKLVWSPDGTRIATAGEDGTVKVWDASNGVLLDTLTYPGPVYALDWHPNGEQIAYGGADLTGSPPEVVIADAPEIPPTATPIDN
ncbi:MAG: hypothetical protein IPM16_21870 [Chloroflexi bacterium]|nr:hypothetical protein [Chloroflexota bacterium]